LEIRRPVLITQIIFTLNIDCILTELGKVGTIKITASIDKCGHGIFSAPTYR
jgi:hypothetical protein